MTLADLKPGDSARVLDFAGDDVVIQRLLEMGLTDGEVVEVVRFAPMGDPMELKVRGYHLSIRKRDAACVLVERP